MKIYFAGSIRGGRADSELYRMIITHLQQYGEVLTEHIGDDGLTSMGEDGHSDREIFDRDMTWLSAADVVVAEVTTPSLGVGFEIGTALSLKKSVICLYRPAAGRRLSAMIAGCREVTVIEYKAVDDLKAISLHNP